MVDCIYNFQVIRQPKMTKNSYCLTEVTIFTGMCKYGCAEMNEKWNHLAKKIIRKDAQCSEEDS